MLKQAARSLNVNKTRTFLSMLGVLIGVAAVIAVMALGTGAKMAVEQRIASMGANLLVLRPGGRESRGVALGAGAVSRLTLNDAELIRSKIDTVKSAAPTVRGTAQVTYENENWPTTVIGSLPVYAEMHDMTPQFGRFFSEAEERSRAGVAVIGMRVWSELFGDENPLGKTIRINKKTFRVIGVLPEKGDSFHFDRDDQIIIPITTAMRRLLGRDYVDSIELQVESAEQLDATESAAIRLMKERHRVDPDDQNAFSVRNMADIQSAIASTSNTMALLLAGIGAISLLVGGIGIMNIMLVSVTERTHEIGIRKAIGARRADILAQFLVESLVISACGGLMGIGLGWSISFAMSWIAGWVVVVTGETILIAFAFSALVGLVFGLWPAKKASALAPIQALRYE
jgi:macrolide transport system ATP-binding/permease protein